MALTTTQIQELDIFDTNSWEFQFVIKKAIRKASDEGVFELGGDFSSQLLVAEKRVLSVSTPFVELTSESKSTGTQYITGFNPIGNVTITFLEDSKLTVQSFLVNWKESIFQSGTSGTAPYFRAGRKGKINAKVKVLAPDGSAYKTISLNGLRILSISEVSFAYTDEPMVISATFMVDNILGYGQNVKARN